MVRGFLAAFGLGLGVQILFGCPEGPYYYDPEQYTPEEYEFATTALGRFLYKYWFTSLRVRQFLFYDIKKFLTQKNFNPKKFLRSDIGTPSLALDIKMRCKLVIV